MIRKRPQKRKHDTDSRIIAGSNEKACFYLQSTEKGALWKKMRQGRFKNGKGAR